MSELSLFGRSGPGAGFERLVAVQDASIGLRAIIAMHSTVRGPGYGGIRRRSYTSEAEAVADVLALAEAMSCKCALAGLPAGGAKMVVLDSPQLQAYLPRAYRAIGRAVEQMAGDYVCGPDLGTGVAELGFVRECTRYINPPQNDAGQATAQGVLAGMRAVWDVLDIKARGSTVAIAGLGSVGRALAASLLDQGVRVLGTDISESACAEATRMGVEVVATGELDRQPCDIYAPCAVGGVLSRTTVGRLQCQAICGSANNQLVDDGAAQLLVEAKILHAPDIIVSAGAVTQGVITFANSGGPQQVEAAIDGLEQVARDVLAEALRCSQPPSEVARERALAILAGR